jgi:acyl-coenzyme A synthetase/AMP-(fatty) acid ligase
MPLADGETLASHLGKSERLTDRFIHCRARSVALAAVAGETTIANLPALRGRAVLVLASEMLAAARAFVELDGLAARMIICPPGVSDDNLALLARAGAFDVAVLDHEREAISRAGIPIAPIETSPARRSATPGQRLDTEWVMFTSGTTGAPKLAAHTLAGLTGAIEAASPDEATVWATFYDIRRYGGLQILLRALLGRTSLVIADPGEDVAGFIARLARHGATHVTGTPSHWRAALMSGAIGEMRPRYLRLSGEIADQPLLDALKAQFPGLPIVHAYASTEAGVGFEVDDGKEGFPASLLERCDPGVELQVENGVLRMRSVRTARRYLDDTAPLLGPDGFVDTGDFVERRGDRFFFVGRRGGVINVGGLKVHPEEVEAVINRHPAVRASRVRGRRNPITGMVVAAEVVLDPAHPDAEEAQVRAEILADCDQRLERFKVPMSLRFVPDLPMTSSGKLARSEGQDG